MMFCSACEALAYGVKREHMQGGKERTALGTGRACGLLQAYTLVLMCELDRACVDLQYKVTFLHSCTGALLTIRGGVLMTASPLPKAKAIVFNKQTCVGRLRAWRLGMGKATDALLTKRGGVLMTSSRAYSIYSNKQTRVKRLKAWRLGTKHG